jgi:hypothetical protein
MLLSFRFKQALCPLPFEKHAFLHLGHISLMQKLRLSCMEVVEIGLAPFNMMLFQRSSDLKIPCCQQNISRMP